MKYDYLIVGGGIVGLATALQLKERRPELRVAILEKEAATAQHQTGHNSGVIHSGIYYAPGSFKARFARAGSQSMVEFCRAHGIAHDVCGKVIVATDEAELPALQNLYQRGLENGLDVQLIGPEALREREPHVAGIQAIRVAATGIVDYKQVSAKYAELIQWKGGEVLCGQRVVGIHTRGDGCTVETEDQTYSAGHVITCAGLHSDRMARLAGARLDSRIVPFRGEYYTLRPERRHLVRHLIYPVPNPAFPFLGVHFTRMIDGEIHAGPNAVLGLRREGYKKTDINARDLRDTLSYIGFRRLARRYWREGWQEMVRSCSKAAFLRSLQRLVPEVQSDDLLPSTAGVRAQALRRDGKLVDDFLIVTGPRSWHVVNAPSPGATASLEIGNHIAATVLDAR